MKKLWKKEIVIWGVTKRDVEGTAEFAVRAIRSTDFSEVSFGLPSKKIKHPESDPDFSSCIEDLL
jgi:hypothetical protein